MAKYRNSFNQPGQSRPHYGLHGTKIPQNGRFGKKTHKNTDVGELLSFGKPVRKSILSELEKDDIGRAKSHGIKLPNNYPNANFFFGVKTKKDESAKNLIYPEDVFDQDEEHAKMYKKSHKTLEAGEQVKRYEVPVDASFRFGKKLAKMDNGVGTCLISNSGPRVVSKSVVNARKVKNPKLSKSKRTEVDTKKIFGRKGKKDEWGAKECIIGQTV